MQEQTFEEKLEHFSSFISLLSGELNVNVSFGVKKEGAGIVLPDISGFDEKRLNFLYALCLREAGALSKSKRRVGSYLDFKTHNDVFAAIQVESARVERFLVRKFAGAAEILEYHWGVEAHDPDLMQSAFGFNPNKASAEQTFFSAIKWSLMGRPRKFKWQALFPKDAWEEAVGVLDDEEVSSLLRGTVLRTWEDSKNLSSELLRLFYQKTHRMDGSKVIAKSKNLEKWEEANQTLTEDLPNRLKPLLEQKDALREQVKKLKQQQLEKLERKGIDLKQMRKDLADVRSQNSALKSIAKPLNQLNSIQERATNKESKLGDAMNHAQEKMDARENRLNALEEKAQQLREEAASREQAINEKEAQGLKDLEDKKDALQQKIEELQSQLSQEGLSEKKKESLEDKISSAQAKMESLDAKMDSVREKSEQARERAEKMRDRANETEQKKEEVSSRGQDAAESFASKEASLKEDIEALKNMAQTLQEQLQKAASEQGVSLKNLDSNAMSENILNLSQKQEHLRQQIEKAVGDQKAIRSLEEKAHELENQARMEAFQVMSKLQSKMDKAGIECELVDRLDEMEGWEGANQAQRDFDQHATSELHVPVINGSGGGRGNRDILTEIAERAEGIGEIDPNEIFQDVARLSPLSGFSESGSREGEGGVASHAHQETLAAWSQSRHTVWSKQFDKVMPIPVKDLQKVNALRQELSAPIRHIKEVFANKMKPSFKLRFKGGREEGDLDARAIWKLAARQGEDYFETSFKKTEKKSSAIVLADLSGSCASWGDEANALIQGISLLLSEGLSKVSIDHEILGYLAPVEEKLSSGSAPQSFNRKTCRLETWVAKSFAEKSIAGIAGLQVQQADNSDGESLRLAVDRIRRRPGKTKLIFMISDGKPFMHDADTTILDEDLRSALMYAASQKIIVWGIGFSTHHPVFGEQYISLQDTAELPRELDRRLS